MVARLTPDDALLTLAQLDAIDLAIDSPPAPNWRFLDEVFAACEQFSWTFDVAAYAILSSRLRNAGLDLDASGLVARLLLFLPSTQRLRQAPKRIAPVPRAGVSSA